MDQLSKSSLLQAKTYRTLWDKAKLLLKSVGYTLWKAYLTVESWVIALLKRVFRPFIPLSRKLKLSKVQQWWYTWSEPIAPARIWIGRVVSGAIFVLIIWFFVWLFQGGCSTQRETPPLRINPTTVDYTQGFNQSYTTTFSDANPAHLVAAKRFGVHLSSDSIDAYLQEESLLPMATTTYYEVDDLTHSIPYLVPEALYLLEDLARDFNESLRQHNLPPHKLVVTSLTRLPSQCQSLRKSNINAAITESAHSYGTTFDISWKRYTPLSQSPADELEANEPVQDIASEVLPEETSTLQMPRGVDAQEVTYATSPEELTRIFASLLKQYRAQGRCLVKYEKKQACFHITLSKKRPQVRDFVEEVYELLTPQAGDSQGAIYNKK